MHYKKNSEILSMMKNMLNEIEKSEIDGKPNFKEGREDAAGAIVELFSYAVNSYSFATTSFIETFFEQHKTLQQSMFRVIIRLIEHMAGERYQFLADGRNQASANLAKELAKVINGRGLPMV